MSGPGSEWEACSAGLAFSHGAEMPELVLHTDSWSVAAAIKVESVPEAIKRFEACGGSVVEAPSEIQIGRLAVVSDPWGNHLVLLDSSKGKLRTDSEGNVTGLGSAA